MTANDIEQTGYTLTWAEFGRRLGYAVVLFVLCWLTLWHCNRRQKQGRLRRAGMWCV